MIQKLLLKAFVIVANHRVYTSVYQITPISSTTIMPVTFDLDMNGKVNTAMAGESGQDAQFFVALAIKPGVLCDNLMDFQE